MRIYDISPTDGTVIDSAGREAPIDPMRQQPRVPAGATDSEPPTTGMNEAARWTGETWEVVPDWRGHVYWLTDGSRHEITELGTEPPADALDEEPPEPLDKLASRKRAEINTARDTDLQAGMPYTMPDGTQETVQTRAQDEPNLLGLAIEARDLKAEGVTDPVLVLRVESNRNYQLTPQQMIELTDSAKEHKKLILGKSWQLKDAVDSALAAEDREAIEAIKW